MKETDIVQALRCCAKGLGHDDACENCKVGEIQDRREYIEFAAANVIERLTAENADLCKEIEWKDMVIALAQRKQAEAEAERDALLEYAKTMQECEMCKNDAGMRDVQERQFTEDAMINLAAQALGVEPSRLRDLAEADKDGRVRIIPESQNETCGNCYNFKRESGTRHGLCEKRPHTRNRYGKIDRSKKFIVYQTTQSCKLYTPLCLCAERAMEEMEGKNDGKT